MSLDKDEIEVTPEMIAAGYEVLRHSGLTDDPLEADKLTVVEIYRAMFSLRRDRRDGSTDSWSFDPITRHGRTIHPNDWYFVRENGVAAIMDGDTLIDEPTDIGQSDFELTLWGIGWLHAHCSIIDMV